MSDPGNEKKGNFWTTLPGILTGLAALITATAGFLAIIDGKNPQPNGQESPTSKPSNSGNLPSTTLSPEFTQTPNPETTPASVAGNWEWEGVGATTLQQNGNEVTGLVRYYEPPVPGLTASLQGNFNQRELTFVWWFTQGPSSPQNPQGEGTLTLSADGRTLNGMFTDRAKGAVRYPWTLKRFSP